MKWVAGVVFSVQIRFIFYAVLGTYGPSHCKTEGCVQIQFILDVVLRTFCPCFLKQWHAGVFRLHLFYKQCLGPLAPRILKQRGVQIPFILDVVLRTFCPHFQKQWRAGVFRLHLLYMQCSGPSAPCIEKLSHLSITKF